MNEIEITFSDLVVAQADGQYDDIKSHIESEFPYPKLWMLKSNIIIQTQMGISSFTLNFYFDKNIVISDYFPNSDINDDVSALSFWAQGAGWNLPTPDPFLIRSNLNFWKFYWETGMIVSKYLDNLYEKK